MTDAPSSLQKSIADARAAIAASMPPEREFGHPSPATAAALVWIEEVNAFWSRRYDQASPEVKAQMDLARKICAEQHDAESLSVVTMGYVAPPIVCTIPPKSGCFEQRVVCIQAIMGGAKPLWAHYLDLAAEVIYRDQTKCQ